MRTKFFSQATTDNSGEIPFLRKLLKLFLAIVSCLLGLTMIFRQGKKNKKGNPTGTVTFLITDTSDYTKLLQEHYHLMETTYPKHNNVIKEIIEGFNGHIFNVVGDSHYAAFSNPTNAIATASAIHRAMQSGEWGGLYLREHISIHTGEVDSVDDNYQGVPLSRAARLVSIAQGGQTLVSHVTHSLVRNSLSEDMQLRDLGPFSLKDFPQQEHIFQLDALGLPSEFLSLKSAKFEKINSLNVLKSKVPENQPGESFKQLWFGVNSVVDIIQENPVAMFFTLVATILGIILGVIEFIDLTFTTPYGAFYSTVGSSVLLGISLWFLIQLRKLRIKIKFGNRLLIGFIISLIIFTGAFAKPAYQQAKDLFFGEPPSNQCDSDSEMFLYPSPTPLPTPTPSPTLLITTFPTDSPSHTPTNTPTSTATRTSQPSRTPTPTSTPTDPPPPPIDTPTPTSTLVPTSTPTDDSKIAIGDYVWNDLNHNGIQDAGEPGIAGVVVNLYRSPTNKVATTTTNASGKYFFKNVNPGNYRIEFILPSGYVFTFQDQGPNDNADSDVNPSTGRIGKTVFKPGIKNYSMDAGMFLMRTKHTQTYTPTLSATNTPTQTASSTPNPTDTPTPTLSPAVTETDDDDDDHTATPTPTPTPTVDSWVGSPLLGWVLVKAAKKRKDLRKRKS